MISNVDKYWRFRMERCNHALANNNFEVYLADNCGRAKNIVMEEILPGINVKSASWGDSLTFYATGILEEIKQNADIRVIETFDPSVSREKIIERRREALSVDLFFSGTNAVTETGKLVNLDMIGNRISAITFGPRHVIILAGRNKIVMNVEDAMQRIKQYAAPINALRHDRMRTPCKKTAHCLDCSGSDRICNTWCITEKSFPKGRITVILINQDLGL